MSDYQKDLNNLFFRATDGGIIKITRLQRNKDHLQELVDKATPKKAFKKWERKEIDIDECIRRFTRNNNIREYDFTTDEFVLWMNSLGYRR